MSILEEKKKGFFSKCWCKREKKNNEYSKCPSSLTIDRTLFTSMSGSPCTLKLQSVQKVSKYQMKEKECKSLTQMQRT